MGTKVVTPAKLKQLEAKERSHDDYLAGLRLAQRRYADYMAEPSGQRSSFNLGFRAALEVIAEGILEAASLRDQENG